MILKIADNRDGSPCWTYYDNIISATVYYDGNIEMQCVALEFFDEPGEVIRTIPEVGYLCNDKGEIIERLARKDKVSNLSIGGLDMVIPKKIWVRACEDLSVYDMEDNLKYEVKEGEIYEAYLYSKTEEYFSKDKKNGREIYVGCIDTHNCLELEPEFQLYFNNKE